MLRLAAAILLAACSPTPPASLSGVWFVELADSMGPQPVTSVNFHLAIAQSEARVVGLGYVGKYQLLLDGVCGEETCVLRAVLGEGEAQSIMFWKVRRSPWGWEGVVHGAGIIAGTVRGRLARESDL